MGDDGVKRTFDTGATRDTGDGKLAYDRFLSPFVIRRYAEYMEKHRVQSDGTLREPDNWKKGIPLPVYRASLTRHVQEVNEFTNPDDGFEVFGVTDYDDLEEALCATIFNAMGMLYEIIQH